MRKPCRLINANNPFPSVCAWVCPHPCEDSCRRAAVDGAVHTQSEKVCCGNRRPPDNRDAAPVNKTGKRWPSWERSPGGLTAAYDLARQGHAVWFTKKQRPGRAFLTSLPVYRLPREMLKEIQIRYWQPESKFVPGLRSGKT